MSQLVQPPVMGGHRASCMASQLFGPGKVQYTLGAPRGAAQRAAREFCDFFVFRRWTCTGNVQFRYLPGLCSAIFGVQNSRVFDGDV